MTASQLYRLARPRTLTAAFSGYSRSLLCGDAAHSGSEPLAKPVLHLINSNLRHEFADCRQYLERIFRL